MTTQPIVKAIHYGKIIPMIAEYGAYDMGKAWFRENGYRYAITIEADAQFDTIYHTNLRDTEAEAEDLARTYGVKAYRL